MRMCGLVWDILDTELTSGRSDLFLLPDDDAQEHGGPVFHVSEVAQVGQGFLRSARLALAFRQFITELDEELTVALALVLWQGENAGHVVVFLRLLFLKNGR